MADDTPLRICSPHCGLSPETTSGGETYEREFLSRLARERTVRVDIILARRKASLPGVPWQIHRFGIRRGLRWWIAPMVVPQAIRRVYPFDLLRVHSVRYMGPSALWARRRYRLPVPIVTHHHHLDANPLNQFIERRVLMGSDRVVVGSEFARRQLASELGMETGHVRVIPYGVDPRFVPGPVRPASPDPCVLYVGGLKARKGLPLLLDCWATVATLHRGTLVLVGDGVLRASLEQRVRDLGLQGRVIFAGYVPEAEKVAYYHRADLACFPSSLEGFGFAVAEAMACGLPVVASDRGALPELVSDGQTGLLFDPTQPAECVRHLLRFLRSPRLRRQFGMAAADRINRSFRWERCVTATVHLYRETVSEWRTMTLAKASA